MKHEIQRIVRQIPLANFGNVKVQWEDKSETSVVMRAQSPADAVRLIAGLRERGYFAHGYTYDANKVGVIL